MEEKERIAPGSWVRTDLREKVFLVGYAKDDMAVLENRHGGLLSVNPNNITLWKEPRKFVVYIVEKQTDWFEVTFVPNHPHIVARATITEGEGL